jgi:LDH2 family malate/lactate/ureidoglycolate dehydrogenase
MLISIEEAKKIAVAKLTRNGVPLDEAEIAVKVHIEGEFWGKRTHGLRHLNNNLIQYRLGANRRTELTISNDTPVSALVDGGFRFPTYIHYTAMKLVIDKASVSGMAMVGARNGGASGLLGFYSQMAAEAGLIGMVFNTAPSTVVPPGSIVPLLSTNPLTIGMPRRDAPPLILDMATGAGTFNQVLVAQRDKKPLPEGMALDLAGKPTTDPFATVDANNRPRIVPFAGYKGFGLSFIIEMLCDAMTGTPIGNAKNEVALMEPTLFNGLYMAFKPDLFISRDEFFDQVETLINDIKNSQKAEGVTEIRIPGEESQKKRLATLAAGQIDLEEPTYKMLMED